MDMKRVLHRVVGVQLIDEPRLHLIAHMELPVDRVVWAPVVRSTIFQRMLVGVVIRLTSTMWSSHSMRPAGPCSWAWPARRHPASLPRHWLRREVSQQIRLTQ
ncbi:MAG: hypothetical protein AUI45_05635 [Acidobacteria bacterium 13_1_40CM_2_56_11]|nr:MAG: hypothetical protein AUI45_05635 [Acidobacteria bacterium 13_1_40CM_2_56_11]